MRSKVSESCRLYRMRRADKVARYAVFQLFRLADVDNVSLGTVIDEPLFLNMDQDAKLLTERAQKIYKECNF